MGRITIFTVDHCPHTVRVRQALAMRKLPYTEISLSEHPERRIDMFHLCDRYSVPQVFFNTRHVGGADVTLKLLRKWDKDCKLYSSNTNSSISSNISTSFATPLERYEFEIGSHPDPSNPQLMHSGAIKAKQRRQNSNQDSYARIQYRGDKPTIKLPDGSMTTYLVAMESMKKILSKGEKVVKSKSYRDVFTHEYLIKTIQWHYNISEVDAEAFVARLGQNKIILLVVRVRESISSNGGAADIVDGDIDNEEDVIGEHPLGTSTTSNITASTSSTFPTSASPTSTSTSTSTVQDESYYRLQCYDAPDILNTYRLHETGEPTIKQVKEVQALIMLLQKLMSNIEREVTGPDGAIDYRKAASNKNYAFFEETVCKLQKVDLQALTDKDEAFLAFALNVYNLLLKYAFIKIGIPTTKTTRHDFMERVSFNIGGEIFSFHDWFHGILRGNAKIPTSRKIQFSRTDLRKKYSNAQSGALKFNYRIHFGLHSHFKSGTPSIPYFTITDADEHTNNTENNSTRNNIPTYHDLSSHHNIPQIEEELMVLSYAFCEDDYNVRINTKDREVTLNTHFRTYRSDFASENTDLALLKELGRYVRGTKKQKLDAVILNLSQNRKAYKITYKQLIRSGSHHHHHHNNNNNTTNHEGSTSCVGIDNTSVTGKIAQNIDEVDEECRIYVMYLGDYVPYEITTLPPPTSTQLGPNGTKNERSFSIKKRISSRRMSSKIFSGVGRTLSCSRKANMMGNSTRSNRGSKRTVNANRSGNIQKLRQTLFASGQ